MKRKSQKAQEKSVVQRSKTQLDTLPKNYPQFLEDIKSRIRTARIKAALAVNSELISLTGTSASPS